MSKNPGIRSDVVTPGQDLEALYLKFLRLFYERGNRERAGQLVPRIEAALAASPELADSIRGEELRALIAEYRGDFATAARNREAEIRKILELHNRTLNTPNWEYVAKQYGFDDVSDRLDLLAILYDQQGELDRAISTLRESKSYCQSHGIPFDAQDLLDELVEARTGETAPAQVPRPVLDAAVREAYIEFEISSDEILVNDDLGRKFAAAVNKRLPTGRAPASEIKRRLLALRKRSATAGGLPPVRPRR